ncbi:unknown [Lactobacillus phage Lb338-1]|uniref:Uncharacterized protein n=1 Tax=Lactobacillus phage Lb338-1 TaxID=2892342 RepID=C1KFF7_9CAUD|nr:hypothetical protein lb338_phage_47 [Lactobacillus phage Lb338-1]ACO36968.1 unknown [Lactobacillus phage Lb338-1]
MGISQQAPVVALGETLVRYNYLSYEKRKAPCEAIKSFVIKPETSKSRPRLNLEQYYWSIQINRMQAEIWASKNAPLQVKST